MQLFYTPDIVPPYHTLGQEESRHAVRVLRLCAGDTVNLTDGRGNLYTAVICEADPAACRVEVICTENGYGRRGYSLTMAVAPTKNPERYEWFLEKATEAGCDVFIPIGTAHGERPRIKAERAEKVIVSAMKQSVKASKPLLEPMSGVDDVITRPFDGIKAIAHCREDIERVPLKNVVVSGRDVLILIGPEGDFSREEINFALANGFASVSLGDSRLRTETAAFAAVVTVSLANQR